jgi:hypothetical protein
MSRVSFFDVYFKITISPLPYVVCGGIGCLYGAYKGRKKIQRLDTHYASCRLNPLSDKAKHKILGTKMIMGIAKGICVPVLWPALIPFLIVQHVASWKV